MANIDRPNGFTPVGTISGSPYNAATREYAVDASNGTAIFKGDVVVLEADGRVAPASAGGNVLGVVTGIKVTGSVGDVDSQGNFLSSGNLGSEEHPGFLPANTAGRVQVEIGPDVLYEVQTAGTLGITNIGNNADLVAGAGSTSTGRSAHELSGTAAATAATFKIVDFVRKPDNEVATANSRWLVTINESQIDPIDDTGV